MNESNDSKQPRFYQMTEHPQEIRLMAALTMRKKPMVFLSGILLFYVMTELIPQLLGIYAPASYVDVLTSATAIDETIAAQLPKTPFVYMLYIAFFSGAFHLGLRSYLLHYLRQGEAKVSLVFEGMTHFFKMLILFIVQNFIIACGLSLFVIPGIYFIFSFSQTYYLMAENPKLSVFRCLVASWRIMDGNRFRLFLLDLTYVILIIMGSLPYAIVSSQSLVDPSTIQGMLTLFAAAIPQYCAYGFLFLGQTVFFEVLVKEGFDHFNEPGEDIIREFRNQHRPSAEE